MSHPLKQHFNRHRLLIIIVFAGLALVIGLTLIIALLSKRSATLEQNSNANVGLPTPTPQHELRPTPTPSPDELATKIGDDVSVWADLEPHEGFIAGRSLEGAWRTNHPMSPPYETEGIRKLIRTLKHDDFFRDNQRVQKVLQRGHFVSDQGIKTEYQLYRWVQE